jgi:CheY-like chemotaxis protein
MLQMNQGEPLIILYVEDDPAHAEISIRNLKSSRLANKIIHVPDGQLALDYLFRQGEYSDPTNSPRPHIILLDLRLPKVDGLEVLEKVREDASFKTIPVVILTTSAAESDIIKAYSHNVNSYLVKPLDFDKFSDLLGTFGFYWLAWNRFPEPME